MSQICYKLHQLFSRLPTHSFPFDTSRIPLNGIYVLFETGELAHGTNRIVRVGTHTGNDQLPSRLEEHFIRENKDRSIFRKNIGRAILNRDDDPFLAQWELDLTTRAARQEYATAVDLKKQESVERRVTQYIQGHFRFMVFRVDDKEERLNWESKIVSTVSLCDECRPSSAWLGRCSPRERIRHSGLWQVNQLYKQPLSEGAYDVLKRAVMGD